MGSRRVASLRVTLLGLGCLMNAAAAAETVRLSPGDTLEEVVAKAASVMPSRRQVEWQRQEISAFIHFGMNTFTDREWGDGKELPSQFNPSALDTRQWVRAAKDAGITRMILTAKHHDGFCLWPSKFTEHSVKNSPWKGGKGDVVGEFVAACRAEGMHYGIYISPWDRHEQSYGDSPRYNRYFLNQLREVLTNYAGIEEVWFDGACAEGPNGKKQVYDWRAYWKLIRELAPDAVISVRGPDVRWCGNEAGHTRASEWSVIPMPGDANTWENSDKTLAGYDRDIYGDDLGSRDALMRSRQDRSVLSWFPSQVNTSIRPGWFYHEGEDSKVRSLAELLGIYYGSVGGNGQFLINLPPDRRGLIHENDVARLAQFGEVLRETFRQNLASGAKVDVLVAGGQSKGDPSTLLDGDFDTFWTTTDGSQSVELSLTLPSPVRMNTLALQEPIASGQRIEAFEVEVLSDGKWSRVAESTVVGHKRLVRFDDVTASAVKIRLTKFRIRPALSSLGLYLAPPVLTPPKVGRDATGNVNIDAPVGAVARYTLDGKNPTVHSPLFNAPFPMPNGGLLLAKSFPRSANVKVYGAADALARVEFGPPRTGWKVIACSSEDIDAKALKAIDGDSATFWETRYRDGMDPMPHSLTIDMGKPWTVRGFTYTPRQDRWPSGIFLSSRFEVSLDGRSWTRVADEVAFDNVVNSRQQQVLHLKKNVPARYFRVTALRTALDNDQASAADISVLVP